MNTFKGRTEVNTMGAKFEINFTLNPEGLEGGYIRYTSEGLPGFSVLCQPNENPLTMIEVTAQAFLPPAIKAWMDDKLVLKGLKFVADGESIFTHKHQPSPIRMAADFERLAA